MSAATRTTSPDSFSLRLEGVLNGLNVKLVSAMNRSFLIASLYEAKRWYVIRNMYIFVCIFVCKYHIFIYGHTKCFSLLSLLPRFPSMRPFERKIALITTAIDLIYTLDFLTEEQKAGIVTLTVKNDTKPCIVKIVNANRDKLIREQFLPDIEKLLSEEKSHEEICDEFVQMKYEVCTPNQIVKALHML